MEAYISHPNSSERSPLLENGFASGVLALAVKTLGLGASVHPRSAGQRTTRFVPEKRLA